MSRIYDNWERLVEAVLKREQFKYLALCESFSSISTDFSSQFNSDSFNENESDQSGELEGEIRCPVLAPIRTKRVEISEECDFVYRADILRAPHYLPDISDVIARILGQHRRPPSVIARLMGLESLPSSSDSEPEKKPELQRSASESRVSKDLVQSRFITDGNYFYPKQQTQSHSGVYNNVMKGNTGMDAQYADPRNHSLKNGKKAEPPAGLNRGSQNSTSPWGAPQQRKSFFDSGDIFPEPKQSISVYGEIEKRLKIRGMGEPSKDLETLKQILEALQLKGLLHSKQQPSQQNQVRHRNESPIVLVKPR